MLGYLTRLRERMQHRGWAGSDRDLPGLGPHQQRRDHVPQILWPHRPQQLRPQAGDPAGVRVAAGAAVAGGEAAGGGAAVRRRW